MWEMDRLSLHHRRYIVSYRIVSYDWLNKQRSNEFTHVFTYILGGMYVCMCVHISHSTDKQLVRAPSALLIRADRRRNLENKKNV